jgi:hypothetical protein
MNVQLRERIANLTRTHTVDDQNLDDINAFISLHHIPVPLPDISHREMLADFKRLCDLQPEAVESKWNSKLEYDSRFPINNLVVRGHTTGNKCSKFFNMLHLVETTGHLKKSIRQVWDDPKQRRRALNILKYFGERENITSCRLNMIIRNEACGAMGFRPSSAKWVYENFPEGGAKRVYDFSAGWGDRLIAALATPTVQMYVATDPHKALQPMYNKILSELNQTGKLCICKDQRAEVYEPHKEFGSTFDLVLTSPPYFDCERYAAGTPDEKNQSWFLYSTVSEWLNGFLFPSLKNAAACLTKGGFLVLNISDIQKGKKRIEICDSMNLYLEGLGLHYVGCVGYALHIRYGIHKKYGKTNLAEPIWIYSFTQ